MTEERKHAILLATVILTARKLQPLLEEDDREGKSNIGTECRAEVYTKEFLRTTARIIGWIPSQSLVTYGNASLAVACFHRPVSHWARGRALNAPRDCCRRMLVGPRRTSERNW